MTNPLLKRKLPKKVRHEPLPDKIMKVSCVLILNQRQARELATLLQKERKECSSNEYTFDKTPLGEVLTALTSCGRAG